MKPIHTVIIILLVANLAATIWFGSNAPQPVSHTEVSRAAEHQLPESITETVRNELLDTFSNSFNNHDMEVLYNMFGPVAKAQISRTDIEEQFGKLIKFFGSINGGAYTHSQLTDSSGNTSIYILFYSVKLSEKSEFGKKGILKITISVTDDEYQVYGIHLIADSSA